MGLSCRSPPPPKSVGTHLCRRAASTFAAAAWIRRQLVTVGSAIFLHTRTYIHTLMHESSLRISVALCCAGKGQRAESPRRLCSTWLSRRGLRRGKDLTEKGGGAPQSPAAGHRGRAGEGRRRWRASGHLPAREAPGCGHTAAGPRRSPVPAGVCGPAPRRNGSGRNFAVDGGAAGNKLENGSALVSKSQRGESLATIMISVTSVKYSIIRDCSSTYCK